MIKKVLLWLLGLAAYCGALYGFGFLLRATGTTWFGNGAVNPQEIPPFVWALVGGAICVSTWLAVWITNCIDNVREREAEERRFVRKLMAEEEKQKEGADGSDDVH